MKNILIVLLAALCLYSFINIKIRDMRVKNLEAQNAVLEEGLKKQIIIEKQKIVYKYRAGEAVKSKSFYLPAEGSFEIKQKEDGDISVSLKDKGFCLKPFAAAFMTDLESADFAAGLRLLYLRRYGLGAALSRSNGALVVIDRKTDDIIPFLSNASLGLFIGRKTAGIGLAVYL